jgi:phosphohistidine phosphatase
MKSLFLIRHAKSSWKNSEEMDDLERPLNKRGERDAPFMAEILFKKNLIPDKIISSPANRALTTAVIFAKQLNYPVENITIEEQLYEASIENFWLIIKKFDKETNNVFLFGHNPFITEFVNEFEDVRIDNVPTSAVVNIRFDLSDWNDTSFKAGRVKWMEYPKLYLK